MKSRDRIGGGANERVSLDINDATYRRLRDEAERRGMPMRELLDRILTDGLRRDEQS